MTLSENYHIKTHVSIFIIYNIFTNKQMSKITLGYWGIGGLAQPLRYLLAYSKL